MTKPSLFRIIHTAIMNRLLLIVIALMIASLFSVLLIRGGSFTGRQPSPEPKRVSDGVSPAFCERETVGRRKDAVAPDSLPHSASCPPIKWQASSAIAG